MIELIGYAGMCILLLSYILLITKKGMRFFIPINCIASTLLTIHAIILKDIPFLVVNGLIAIMLFVKFIRGVKWMK